MNKGKWKGSQIEGSLYEDQFHMMALERGFYVRKSTLEEDMMQRFDFEIAKGGKSFRVDVKAPKRTDRHGRLEWDTQWVEFVNVEGYGGSLYEGDPDTVMAFGLPDGFLLVAKSALQRFAESNVLDEWVYSPSEALYRKYTRKGRKDVISKISLSDLARQAKCRKWKRKK